MTYSQEALDALDPFVRALMEPVGAAARVGGER